MKCPRCEKMGSHGWLVQDYFCNGNKDGPTSRVEGIRCVICGFYISRPKPGFEMERETNWAELAGTSDWKKCKVRGCDGKATHRKGSLGLCLKHGQVVSNYRTRYQNRPPQFRPPFPYLATSKGWILNKTRRKVKEECPTKKDAEPVTTPDGKD